MTLSAIWALVLSYKDEASLGFFILIVAASIVQISAIKIYPFDWLLGIIGKKLNKEISDKVDNMRKELDQHIADDKKEKLEGKRRDILEFANSCMTGRRHTQEQFAFMLKTCDEYEKYIEDNELKNGEISSAIEEIRRLNIRCRQKNSFLKPGEEFDP